MSIPKQRPRTEKPVWRTARPALEISIRELESLASEENPVLGPLRQHSVCDSDGDNWIFFSRRSIADLSRRLVGYFLWKPMPVSFQGGPDKFIPVKSRIRSVT